MILLFVIALSHGIEEKHTIYKHFYKGVFVMLEALLYSVLGVGVIILFYLLHGFINLLPKG